MTALFTAPSVDEIIAKLGAQSTCDAGLTQDPWHFDTTTPSYGCLLYTSPSPRDP